MPNYGIHNYANREIGLTTPQVQMATFTPLEFKWQGVDPEFLSKHLQYAETKDAEAQKEKTAIDLAYAEQRKQIHQDDKTKAEFDKIVEDYNQQVKNAVDASGGSYHRLGNLMKQLASDNASNKGITTMIEHNQAAEKWKEDLHQKLVKKEISDVRYRRLLKKLEDNWDTNENKLVKRDAKGNIVDGDTWTSNIAVYDKLNPAVLAGIVNQLTAYQQQTTSKGSSTPVTINDNLKVIPSKQRDATKDPYTGISSSSHSYTLTSLTKKQLDKTLDDYIAVNNEIISQFGEELEDLLFEYNEWNDQINDNNIDDATKFNINKKLKARANIIFGKGAGSGSVIDAQTYFKNSMRELIHNSSYNRWSKEDTYGLSLNSANDKNSKIDYSAIIDLISESSAIPLAEVGVRYDEKTGSYYDEYNRALDPGEVFNSISNAAIAKKKKK